MKIKIPFLGKELKLPIPDKEEIKLILFFSILLGSLLTTVFFIGFLHQQDNADSAIFGLAEIRAHPTDPNKDLVGGLYNIAANIGELAEATNRQAAALEAFVALQSPQSNTVSY